MVVDSHDIVVRVSNYKLSKSAGFRTDVHYSFYGNSTRSAKDDLIRDGVILCMCKCPDGKIMNSPWHAKRMKLFGVDFRYIYYLRKDWWFCDTYIPEMHDFMAKFKLLGNRIPTTGFSAILDIIDMKPRKLFLTGFDFFQSKVHNVDEPWKPGDESDPIGHVPDMELDWVKNNLKDISNVTFDKKLESLIYG